MRFEYGAPFALTPHRLRCHKHLEPQSPSLPNIKSVSQLSLPCQTGTKDYWSKIVRRTLRQGLGATLSEVPTSPVPI